MAAFSLLLHTWRQDLARHVHAHALVAGGALGPAGQWIAPKKGFLFSVRALSRVFRGKYVAALEALRGAVRFLQHVLPPGFKRIRRYGLLSPARKKDALAAARAALGVPPPQPAAIESVAVFLRRVSQIEHLRCPHCAGGQFRLVGPIAPQRHLVNARGPP